jgi:hypothetical protein
MTVATGVAEVWNSGDSFCSQCLTTEPHFDGMGVTLSFQIILLAWFVLTCVCFIAATRVLVHVGPNGLVYVSSSDDFSRDSVGCIAISDGTLYGDYLLVALGSSSNRLLKVNATAAFQLPIVINITENAGILSQMDGMVITMPLGSSSGSSYTPTSTLFIVGNGVNSIFALTSSDDWATATLRATYNANCPQNQPSALVIVDNSVVCYCTNGFGPAPYPLTILTEAAGK